MNQPLFKPGDKVIRVEDSASHAIKSETYTVEQCTCNNIVLCEITGNYEASYFRLVEENKQITSNEGVLTEFLN